MSTERKKILVFTDWYLPGFKAGGPIRSLANLVSRVDYDFYIVTRNQDHHSTEPYPGINTGEWTRLGSNCMVYYISENKVGRTQVGKLLEEKNWHRIYLNSLFSRRFTLIPLQVIRKKKMAKRVILAPRGMLQPGALSIKANKKAIFLFLSKLIGLFGQIRWHATSESELKAIKKYAGENVDVFYAPNLSAAKVIGKSPISKSAGELKLISIARISPEKGILEAIQFLAAAGLNGKISVAFYGTQQNFSYHQKCMSLATSIPGVEITFPGEVDPALIASLMSTAHFFYSATWGENHGHAIVESLQCGIPVIISNRTPWKNLFQAGAGWDLEPNETEFSKVLQLALEMNQEEYGRMCSNAALLGETISKSEEAIRLNIALFE